MTTHLILLVLIAAADFQGYLAINSNTLCINKTGVESNDSLCESANFTSELSLSCEKEEAGEECFRLKSSSVAFQPFPAEKKLRIALNAVIQSSLELNIVSGSCMVNCTGGLNECDTDVRGPIDWRNVSDEFYINSLESSKYYCIRASIKGCCLICTHTVKLEEPLEEGTAEVKVVPMYIVYSCAFLVVIVWLAVLVLAAHLCGISSCSTRPESTSYSNLPHEINSTPAAPLVMVVMGQPSVELLLLYSRDSLSFHNVIDVFKSLLKNCGLEVWDPFDEDEIESIRTYQGGWLDNVLEKKELRVVLVETDIAVMRQKPLLDDNWKFEFEDKNYLDRMFIYGLQHLRNHDRLCYKYNRLFVVRVGSVSVCFENFVPVTRYNLPIQWKNLVCNVYGLGSDEDFVKIPTSPRVPELEAALESSIRELENSPPLTYHLTKVN